MIDNLKEQIIKPESPSTSNELFRDLSSIEKVRITDLKDMNYDYRNFINKIKKECNMYYKAYLKEGLRRGISGCFEEAKRSQNLGFALLTFYIASSSNEGLYWFANDQRDYLLEEAQGEYGPNTKKSYKEQSEMWRLLAEEIFRLSMNDSPKKNYEADEKKYKEIEERIEDPRSVPPSLSELREYVRIGLLIKVPPYSVRHFVEGEVTGDEIIKFNQLGREAISFIIANSGDEGLIDFLNLKIQLLKDKANELERKGENAQDYYERVLRWANYINQIQEERKSKGLPLIKYKQKRS